MSGTSINSIPVYDPNAVTYVEHNKSTQELQDNFFTMLTAQLEYQDPLKPMENVEFTNQMIGFYDLQQQQAGNKLLEQLVGSQQGDNLNQGVSYLGKMLTVEGNTMTVANGQGVLGFETTEPFIGHVAIYNGENQLVKSLPDQQYEAGQHSIDINDANLTNGTYHFRVVAATETGATITTLESGIASGAENNNGTIQVRLNNHAVTLDKIRQVVNADNG